MIGRRFTLILAIAVGLLSVLPFIYGTLITPPGTRYLGFQFGTDDQMVYAAWMRQVMNGHFLMDNRFAVDPQPGLTIHVYFWLLGLVAKVTGIGTAAALARAGFGFLFVMLLARLVRLVTNNSATFKLSMLLACFGAGIGFMAWQPLGVDFVQNSGSPLKDLLLGHLPNDVWQPEGFVFSSLLTNSLFSVSLCLIVGILYCVLRSRDSWKPVLPGALCFLVLMNIHSYDVLLLALVLIGLLVASVVRKQITAVWLVRVVLIGLGAVPAALWFVYVLRHDPVFQARAATPTYTENFRSILAGYSLLMALGLVGAIAWLKSHKGDSKTMVGLGLAAVTLLGMFIAAGSSYSGYWMGVAAWALLFVVMLVALALLARENPGQNLILSWALVGIVAPYLPGLFERKLMMGLSIPWAVLAGLGLSYAIAGLKLNERKLVAGLGALLLSATSLQWLSREFMLINANESNTGQQRVFLSSDETKIIDYLNDHIDDHRTVVLAIPPLFGAGDTLGTPPLPDDNPIISGLTGAYTYAGHWSETPQPEHRQGEQRNFFLTMPLDEQKAFLKETGADYIVAPIPEKLDFIRKVKPSFHVNDMQALGTTVVSGDMFRLVKVGK
jgi:arabinosyltransferase C